LHLIGLEVAGAAVGDAVNGTEVKLRKWPMLTTAELGR
jgi:hypothetical protein